MKYGKITLGQVEAIINMLGGEKGALKVLQDGLFVIEPSQEFLEFVLCMSKLELKKPTDHLESAEWEEIRDRFIPVFLRLMDQKIPLWSSMVERYGSSLPVPYQECISLVDFKPPYLNK